MLYANIRVTVSTAKLPTTSLCNARFWLGHLGFTIVPGHSVTAAVAVPFANAYIQCP